MRERGTWSQSIRFPFKVTASIFALLMLSFSLSVRKMDPHYLTLSPKRRGFLVHLRPKWQSPSWSCCLLSLQWIRSSWGGVNMSENTFSNSNVSWSLQQSELENILTHLNNNWRQFIVETQLNLTKSFEQVHLERRRNNGLHEPKMATSNQNGRLPVFSSNGFSSLCLCFMLIPHKRIRKIRRLPAGAIIKYGNHSEWTGTGTGSVWVHCMQT